jgi:2-C-methyl-D-erythritol 4-phosphate cytidylyltransferase
MNIAIICAGGNGERMHTKENKIFIKVGKKPLIYYTLKSFYEYDPVDAIVITARAQDVRRVKAVASRYGIDKLLFIDEAKETRQASTCSVLRKLKDMNLSADSYILIHNAVNPFVRHAELDDCMQAARECGASLLGFRAVDTVKVVDGGRLIDYTPDRNRVWIAQTPQVIRFDIALRAFEYAHENGLIATDDTSLVEAIHEKVKFVECSRENFKITYPQDLGLTRLIHKKRMKEKSVWYA